MLCKRLATKSSCGKQRLAKARYTVKSAREPFHVVTVDTAQGVDLNNVETLQTELSGGVKVLSVDTPVPVTTLSVYVQAGSRYETYHTTGASHFLKHLAHRGTLYKSPLRLVRDLEYLGATFTPKNTRDHMVYHISAPRQPENKKDQVEMAIIAETLRFVLSPSLFEFEVEGIKPVVLNDIKHTNVLDAVLDSAHVESFRDSGLGQSLYCPEYAVQSTTAQTIHSHVQNYYYPGNRITIVGTGIEHSRLLSHVTNLFTNPKLEDYELGTQLGGEAAIASTVAKRNNTFYREFKPLHADHPTSQKEVFTGGASLRLPCHENTTVAVVYPGVGQSHADYVVFAVLKEALGAAGVSLGEGLSLPFARIGSQHPFVKSASAYNFSYSDAGLFALVGVAEVGGHGAVLAQALNTQLKGATSLSDAELSTAKHVLKAKLVRSWFSGEGTSLSDHIAYRGTESFGQFLKRIDGVTLGDISRVVKSITHVQPNIVAAGDVRGVPVGL